MFNRIVINGLLVSLTLAMFSCTAASPPATSAPQADAAGFVAAYRDWSIAQVDQLLEQVEAFSAAVIAGDRAKAKALYAPSRMYYERIEPVAEALGELDPRIDAREGDVKAEDWQGYHKLEKLLWSDADLAGGKATASALLDDVRLLRARLETATIDLPLMVGGAVELLNEVSTSKVTGEEERYSHTDLWDFQANVEGSAKIWELVTPSVRIGDSSLAATLDERFAALLALLATHQLGDGYKLYTALKPQEIKDLVAAVDALAEPLSQVGKVLIKG